MFQVLGAFIPSVLRAYQRVICEGVVHLDVHLEITLKTMKEQTEKMQKGQEERANTWTSALPLGRA